MMTFQVCFWCWFVLIKWKWLSKGKSYSTLSSLVTSWFWIFYTHKYRKNLLLFSWHILAIKRNFVVGKDELSNNCWVSCTSKCLQRHCPLFDFDRTWLCVKLFVCSFTAALFFYIWGEISLFSNTFTFSFAIEPTDIPIYYDPSLLFWILATILRIVQLKWKRATPMFCCKTSNSNQ